MAFGLDRAFGQTFCGGVSLQVKLPWTRHCRPLRATALPVMESIACMRPGRHRFIQCTLGEDETPVRAPAA